MQRFLMKKVEKRDDGSRSETATHK